MKVLHMARTMMAALLLLGFFSCSDSNDNAGLASVSVRLTDAPGDYEAVNIDVQDVQVQIEEAGDEESDSESGWQSLSGIQPGVYNLLELTGGISALLADAEVPSGKLTQMRLVLGPENTIVMEGETFPLQTPSAQQSGLKLLVNQTLEAGFSYDFLIDIDVDKSVIIEAGASGNILLSPVLRVSTQASTGKVTGIIEPLGVSVMASIVSEELAIAAYADENGVFVLHGIPEGTYDILISPDPESGYGEQTLEGVVVVNGEVTDVGTITLTEL